MKASILNADSKAVADIERILACIEPYADSLTLWVSGTEFAAWAHVIGAEVMHTMASGHAPFAWCTGDNTNRKLRVAVHTYDRPAPWVHFPPRGSEDTKRYMLAVVVNGIQ